MTNPVWLVLLLCLSPLGAVLIILVVKILINWNKEDASKVHKSIFISREFKSIFILDERELESQGPFWLSILIPILYFFHLGYYSWENHHLHLSGEGIKLFFEISKMPLAILSISVPATILISRMHASKQVAKQIKITEEKNNIDLYSSYRKDLVDYFKNIEKVNFCGCLEVKFKLHNRIYKEFFVGSPIHGIPTVNVEAFKYIETTLSSARNQLNKIIRGHELYSVSDTYLAFCNSILVVSAKLYLFDVHKLAGDRGVLVPIERSELDDVNELITLGTTSGEAVAAYRCVRDFFYHLCDYTGYESSLIDKKDTAIIDEGEKYLNVNDYFIIERLFENEFFDCKPKADKSSPQGEFK